MDILIELTYAALVFAAFKIFRIPANKWTITTAVVGGVFVVGGIFLTMAYYHPYTPDGRVYFRTTPIMPQVRGLVVNVPVKANAPLKKGEELFSIDPRPYQDAVDNLEAALEEANAKLRQLDAEVKQADAEVSKTASQFDLASKTERRFRQLVEQSAIAQQRYDDALATLQVAEQSYRQALAREMSAQLNKARFDLESTVVRAPADGYVVQLRLQPGMMAVPLPLKPVMTFVPNDGAYLVGGFKQNPLQNIRVGHAAEVIFPALPGRAFQGRVTKILGALAEGQMQPESTMIAIEDDQPEGRAPVFIELDEDLSQYNLPAGCAASVAVYSEEMEFLAPIRQILLRMLSWKNIICFEMI